MFLGTTSLSFYINFLGQQRQEQQEAIVAAQRYYDLSNIRYKTGVDTYLNVLLRRRVY